jgi:hypothetical protein
MAVANKKVDTTSMPPYALALRLSKELVLVWYLLMRRRTLRLASVHLPFTALNLGLVCASSDTGTAFVNQIFI